MRLSSKGTKSDNDHILSEYVFERLNSGGRPCAQMRSSIYAGRFNDAIVRLAREDKFAVRSDSPHGDR